MRHSSRRESGTRETYSVGAFLKSKIVPIHPRAKTSKLRSKWRVKRNRGAHLDNVGILIGQKGVATYFVVGKIVTSDSTKSIPPGGFRYSTLWF